jgi:iron-sulfur cluster repair protein YtfE (RIC family)
MADLLSQLESEHRQVSQWLEQLEQAEGADERMQLLSRVESALSEHMSTEEREVYPLLAELDAEMAQEASNEHAGARELLAKVREMAPDVPGFGAAVAALAGAIEHHVEEEEGEAFPKLRKGMRGRIPPATGSGLADAMTRDELYERARELDISGRSTMTKGDLAHAVEMAESHR